MRPSGLSTCPRFRILKAAILAASRIPRRCLLVDSVANSCKRLIVVERFAPTAFSSAHNRFDPNLGLLVPSIRIGKLDLDHGVQIQLR